MKATTKAGHGYRRSGLAERTFGKKERGAGPRFGRSNVRHFVLSVREDVEREDGLEVEAMRKKGALYGTAIVVVSVLVNSCIRLRMWYGALRPGPSGIWRT